MPAPDKENPPSEASRMTKNPWFRAYTEMVDDEKLRLLAFEDRWHFVALLCCKGSGLLDSGGAPDLLRRKLAVKLGLAPRELEEVARRLSEVGLINHTSFQPLAWNERQFKSDTSTERVRRYRERTKQEGNVSVTAQETDTDTETEKKQKKSARRAPVLPDWLPADAWTDWHTYRQKRTAKAWTAKAQQLSLATLTSLRDEGHDPVKVIEASIEKGWTGLFPLNSNKLSRGTNNADHTHRPLSAVERVRAHVVAAERRDADAAVGHLPAYLVAPDG